jgi:aspartyl/asparaginyl beta-hydroxylase (cupin superfamily)
MLIVDLLSRLLFTVLAAVERLNRKYSLVGDHWFFDEGRFDWIEAVKARAPLIKAELDKVMLRRDELPNFQDISPEQAELTTDARWKTFFFYGYGVRRALNCTACPETARALSLIPGMSTAFFSVLAPGKHLPAHRGPYNGVLRFHLGLQVPRDGSRCEIRVGQETRKWCDGGALVFDDSYDHEAWNLSDEWRVVLFVDFSRPLPRFAAAINQLMLWLIRKSPIISVATRNQANWEQVFHRPQEAGPAPDRP